MRALPELSGTWNPETIAEEEAANKRAVSAAGFGSGPIRYCSPSTTETAAWLDSPTIREMISSSRKAEDRKATPVYSGVLIYFPLAMQAVAQCSRIGNDQHNPDTDIHWDREKSGDEHDALVRHLMKAGQMDTDGVRHSTKVAWRALAALEKELEADGNELL